MDTYTLAQREIAKQLAQFGAPVVTQRPTTTFNAVTSTNTTSYTTLSRKGLVTGVLSQLRFELKLTGHSNIMISDKMVIFGSDGLTTENDKIVINGLTYQVIKVIEINPAGSPLLFKVVVRR